MSDSPKNGISSVVHQARAQLASRATGAGHATAQAPSADRSEPDRVLDAAAELFLRSGFAKTSLEDVARAAGIGLGQISKLCFSKEDLLFQVLSREVISLAAESKSTVAEDVPFQELMRVVSERAFGMIESRPLILRLLLRLWDADVPSWEARFHELRQRLITVPVEVLKIGVRQGVLREDLPIELVAALLFEVHVSGYLLHYRPGPDLELRAQQRRTLAIDILFNGLRVRDEE